MVITSNGRATFGLACTYAKPSRSRPFVRPMSGRTVSSLARSAIKAAITTRYVAALM